MPQEAIQFARDISLRSPDSVAATKVLYNETMRTGTEREALLLETELQRRLLPSWNQLAAVAATLRRAPPRYIRRKRAWDRYLKH
jgi:enoyl-CoA hydratase/carnithine racemase